MIELKFPDGASREYPAGATGRDVAASISPSLAKRAALVEHRTQIATDGPFFAMPEDIGRQWFGMEYFTLLQSRVALPERQGYEDDLFCGIVSTDL